MNDSDWFNAHVGRTDPEDAFRISIDVYPQQDLALSPAAQMGGLNSNTYGSTFPASNLPPSLYAVSGFSQPVPWAESISADAEMAVHYPEDDEFDIPETAAPNSFFDRMLRAERMQREKSMDDQSLDISWPPRVDSAVGDIEDQLSFAESDSVSSDPFAQIAQENDSAYGSMPLQYHLIQTKSQIAMNESFQRERLSNSTSQAPSSPGHETETVLYCDLCDPRRSFRGNWAPRNLSRHMDQAHTPCTSSSGMKDFRCGLESCPRIFRRADARLVHERHSHPELNRPPPVRRKRSGEE